MSRLLLCVAAACAATTAAAQQAGPIPAPGARAQPAPTYDSAFRDYRPYREETVVDWRAINEEVGRIGGHVGIVGGAGHGAHGEAKPPAGSSEAGQAPVSGAPKAPANHGHSSH